MVVVVMVWWWARLIILSIFINVDHFKIVFFSISDFKIGPSSF